MDSPIDGQRLWLATRGVCHRPAPLGFRRMETLRIPVGGTTASGMTFDAVAAGPADGRPVLLLHGFPQGPRQWTSQLQALAGAGYRAVALDQRGYSPDARPVGVEHYTSRLLAQDVVDVADALGFSTVDVVGHDWGAAVAWQVAARHPDRTRSLVALSVPHPVPFGKALRTDPDQQQRSQYMLLFRAPAPKAEQVLSADGMTKLRAWFDGTGVPVDSVEHYMARMSDPARLTAALSWYRGSTADDVAIGPITCPVTYVWSDDDHALGRGPAEATAQYVDGPYRFVELSGVTHWMTEQVPDTVDRVLLEHLAAS